MKIREAIPSPMKMLNATRPRRMKCGWNVELTETTEAMLIAKSPLEKSPRIESVPRIQVVSQYRICRFPDLGVSWIEMSSVFGEKVYLSLSVRLIPSPQIPQLKSLEFEEELILVSNCPRLYSYAWLWHSRSAAWNHTWKSRWIACANTCHNTPPQVWFGYCCCFWIIYLKISLYSTALGNYETKIFIYVTVNE